ncbi:MAG: TIGR01459 family HAD-type hydrolase [Hyphomicrobiaceae bacterium]
MSSTSAPPIIDEAADLLARYDVLFCDVWGVVHNGRTAYVEGCAALRRFRDAGGTVILVSNAPRTAAVVARVLAEKNVPETSWDAIVPSGDLALQYAHSQGFRQVHHIGPDRDLDVFDETGIGRVAMEDADAIFCTGLVHDRAETGADYKDRLRPALDRQLALICANPDLVVDVGGDLLPCAGAVAQVYEELGGHVHWAGKPFATAYEAAHRNAEELRGTKVDKHRILAIGDAVRTDISGAVAYGLDALFVGQGIHRQAVMPDGVVIVERLERLFHGQPQAIAATATLRW